MYNGVNYAAEADLYAVVDWHILSDSNPLQHVSEAKEFFARTSTDLADHTNVLQQPISKICVIAYLRLWMVACPFL